MPKQSETFSTPNLIPVEKGDAQFIFPEHEIRDLLADVDSIKAFIVEKMTPGQPMSVDDYLAASSYTIAHLIEVLHRCITVMGRHVTAYEEYRKN